MMDAKKLMWDIGCGELTEGIAGFYCVTPKQLDALIGKVTDAAVLKEREAIAQMVEAKGEGYNGYFITADAIRARGTP